MKAMAMKAALVASAAAFGEASAVASPVERVVNLLTELKEKLTQDEKSEQQAYDKYACWCEKTTARKAGSITDATADLRSLGQDILSHKGRVATLTSEIAELVAQIRANKKAQEEATSIRQKGNAAFMAEQAETKQAIAALEEAITVLVGATNPTSAASGSALLQASERATAAVRSVISALPPSAVLKNGQLAQLDSFLQAKYMPQSFTVQGILVDMYKNFASDLEKATFEEAASNRNFEAFIDQKETEMKQHEADKAVREKEKVEKEAKLAESQQLYDDTTATKMADVAFFDQTKQSCLSKHDEWTTRSSLRDEEIQGITQALEILSTDDARALFASAIKEGKETGADDSYDTGRDITSFLQVMRGAGGEEAPPMRAYAALKKVASASHSFRLAALAVQVREAKVGHFTKVLRSIDSMITTLKQEAAADIEKRDQCKDEYQKIESKVKNVTWLIKKNVAKIDKLNKLIQTREEEKQQTIDDIADVDASMLALTQTRQAENTAFLNAKSEDQQAIDLLMDARTALMSYYKNHSVDMGPIQGSVKGLGFVQQPEFEISADQAPDTVFSGKDKRRDESKGIVAILTTVIEDLNDEIKNGMRAEEVAQLEYEAQMKSAKALREKLVARETSLTQAIADRRQDVTDEETDMNTNKQDLQDEKDYKANIQSDCDFILRTFEKRAASRTAEMQGLAGAKEYLAGYEQSQAALLEKKQGLPGPSFDDTALSRTGFLGIRH